ncbi:hypothetical protein RD110_11015 [Rhodoferax koreense]|uniref:Uncharacterized protein n=1 Tax=Rhodoferax koreensis TaxID=1842727 RepID=A0A1P8JV80_9BURK|nr:hypothetical protein [Rhodoferax koreense]APW37657.1 hypothetical protein RD110_11015 [Rhodoferax koreense]
MANPYLATENPYLTSSIDKAQGDLVRNYNMTAQPAYNNAMVKSGSFGNAGVQQLNENSQKNLQSSLGDISNTLRGNAYNQNIQNYQWDQNFDRSLYNDAFSQNNQNLQTGIGLLSAMNGYNQQDLNNGTTVQNTPLNYYGQFSQNANSLGQGFGTTTGVQGSSGSPITSALGGAQLGNSIYNQYKNGSGNTDWVSGSGNYAQYTNPDYGQFF